MRLNFDARAWRLLRRMPVVNVYSALELLLLAGLAVQSARLLWAIVTPIAPVGDWRPAEPTVTGSPAAILTGFDPFYRLSGGDAAKPQVVTSLQLKLFGTRMDEATGRGSAILAGPDGLQKSIAVGEEILPGVKLKTVAFDHVTIDRGGADEDVFLDQSGSVQPVQPGAAPLATPATGAPAANGAVPFAQVRQDIGFIPRIDAGRISGLVVRSQGSGAAFRASGLRDGDVVTAIGGHGVTGPGDLERVAADFGAGGNIPITVERGDQTLPLSIPVSPK